MTFIKKKKKKKKKIHAITTLDHYEDGLKSSFIGLVTLFINVIAYRNMRRAVFIMV